jgi:MinD superfamily P-loop ATPase
MKIAIASGKGGTGKTTLAVNLACFAAEKENVFLADLDVEEPNSGIFIHGEEVCQKNISKKVPVWDKEKCILCGKCSEWCRFHSLIKLGETILVLPELCHSCFACSELCPTNALPMQNYPIGVLNHYQSGNLQFVQGKLNVGSEQATPLIHQTLDSLNDLQPQAEIQIFDSPPGTSCSMIAAAQSADFALLVTEPTPFGLHDLKLAVETMKAIKKPFSVIVNRYGIGNDDVFQYCKENNIEIIAKIPNLRSIAEYYSQGKMIYHNVKEFSDAIEEIFQFIENMRRSVCEK